jgi:MFS family permease
MPDTGPLFAAATGAAVAMMLLALLLVSTRIPGHEAVRGGAGVRQALAVPGLPVAMVTSLTVIAAVDLLTVYLPLLGTERGIAASTIGALLVVRAAASMASRLFLTPLIRRFSRTRLLTWTIALAALSTGLLAVQMPTWMVTVVMVLVGLGLGLGQPLTMAWVAEAAPAGVRATALSLRIAGNRLGQTLLPAGVGFVASGGGSAGVFLAIGGGLGATSMVVGRSAPDTDVEGDADA